MNPDLSLVLACYNESEHLEESFARLHQYLEKHTFNYELIIVEDKSTDNTRHIINKILSKFRANNIKYIKHSVNKGRGRSIMDGINIAKGDIVGFIDVDLEVGPEYIAGAVKKLDSCDVVVGKRTYAKSLKTKHRDIASRAYASLVRLFFKPPISDTEAGFKFFMRKKIMPILPEIENNGWFWDTEIIIRCYMHNLRIKEIPVRYVRRDDKTSTVNMIKDPIIYLHDLVKFSLKQKLHGRH